MCETCPTCGRRVTKARQHRLDDGGDAELFASYKRTAPRLDLETYLAHAARRTLDAKAQAIVERMMQLHDRIMQMGDTGREKAQVWALISQFKSATIDWTEQANGCKKMRLPLPSIQGEKDTLRTWELSPLMKAARRQERA